MSSKIMSLVFAGITPHPPIIIPTIGKDNLKQVAKTARGMKKLEEIFYASRPEVIIIISPHGPVQPEVFTINIAEKFVGHFEEFGDFKTKLAFDSSLGLAHQLKERAENKGLAVNIVSQSELDHGSLVPLWYLTQNLAADSKNPIKIKIIPITYSLLDYETHFKLGQAFQEMILKTNQRVALIASGDLSHRLLPEAPAGFSLAGKTFDEKLVGLIKKRDIKSILKMDPGLVEEAGECGFRSFLILFGLLDGINYKPEVISYEGPFGVGYLVANFKLA